MSRTLPSNTNRYRVAEHPDVWFSKTQLYNVFSDQLENPVLIDTFKVRLQKHKSLLLSEATIIELLTRKIKNTPQTELRERYKRLLNRKKLTKDQVPWSHFKETYEKYGLKTAEKLNSSRQAKQDGIAVVREVDKPAYIPKKVSTNLW